MGSSSSPNGNYSILSGVLLVVQSVLLSLISVVNIVVFTSLSL